jgi:hypothetical protein
MLTSLLRSLPFLCLVLVALSGCGDGTVATNKLSGKLILPPGVKVAETDSIMVTLTPTEGDKGGGSGTVNAKDLTFSNVKVAPGKYKVLVNFSPYQGEPGSDKRVAAFEMVNKAYDLKNSKIICEVGTEKEQSVVIDMAKGSATKQ